MWAWLGLGLWLPAGALLLCAGKQAAGKAKPAKDGKGKKAKAGKGGGPPAPFAPKDKKAPVNPHEPDYGTLHDMQTEKLLPKDKPPAGLAKANFKVDDRIKKGRHVFANAQNYQKLNT